MFDAAGEVLFSGSVKKVEIPVFENCRLFLGQL